MSDGDEYAEPQLPPSVTYPVMGDMLGDFLTVWSKLTRNMTGYQLAVDVLRNMDGFQAHDSTVRKIPVAHYPGRIEDEEIAIPIDPNEMPDGMRRCYFETLASYHEYQVLQQMPIAEQLVARLMTRLAPEPEPEPAAR